MPIKRIKRILASGHLREERAVAVSKRANEADAPVERVRTFILAGQYDLAMDEARREVFGGALGAPKILRVAEMFVNAGRRGDAIAAYEAAMDRFAAGGFIPHALAVAKKVAAMAPDDPEKAARVKHIEAQRGSGQVAVSTVAPMVPAVPSTDVKPIDLSPVADAPAIEIGYSGSAQHAVDIGGADPFEIEGSGLAALFADDSPEKRRAA